MRGLRRRSSARATTSKHAHPAHVGKHEVLPAARQHQRCQLPFCEEAAPWAIACAALCCSWCRVRSMNSTTQAVGPARSLLLLWPSECVRFAIAFRQTCTESVQHITDSVSIRCARACSMNAGRPVESVAVRCYAGNVPLATETTSKPALGRSGVYRSEVGGLHCGRLWTRTGSAKAVAIRDRLANRTGFALMAPPRFLTPNLQAHHLRPARCFSRANHTECQPSSAEQCRRLRTRLQSLGRRCCTETALQGLA